MIIDLKTGEIYKGILYKDASDVILAADHGESHMGADQFGETIIFPGEAPGWAILARYQTLGTEPEPFSSRHFARRVEIAAYAERNGGQIAHHIEPEKTGIMSRIGRFLKGA